MIVHQVVFGVPRDEAFAVRFLNGKKKLGEKDAIGVWCLGTCVACLVM